MGSQAYRAAGVDLDAAARVKELFKPYVRSTFTPQVIGDVGLFGGCFRLQGYQDPVLVASTDSVGTKIKLALWLGRFDTIGHDLVNHCVNDVYTTGARPLFFLDYVAVERLVPSQVAALVRGVAEACKAVGCVLLGGETAQLPGIYAKGALDLAGFLVGAAEREALLDPLSTVRGGDVLLGIPSSGLHTNGYSLVRSVYRLDEDPAPLKRYEPELGRTLGEALLEPHRCYYPLLEPAMPLIRGMAHITGGGLPENLARIMPKGLTFRVDKSSWEVPPLFRLIQRQGNVSDGEMERVFNLGVGMVLACAPERAAEVQRLLPEAWVLGEVVPS
ncbi:MAG: phosphoribosylformylglycinamidine cyclo-ligase [Chloroflexi bacterium]|nr:phosphoribosylformylglycinamidine cyclo-ligase [Chloroflexota bacterium]